jgi:DNA-binding NarL/FixJ family response regulator
LDPHLAGKVLAEFRSRLQTEVTLTDEQTRLLRLIARGRTYLQISLSGTGYERTYRQAAYEEDIAAFASGQQHGSESVCTAAGIINCQ